jgi:selenocysteine lyase/cysteine desulfurase
MFSKKITDTKNDQRLADFNYLSPADIYLDSACQSLRPQPVIDALNDYYTNYNACGDRVKYKWGQKVDTALNETRRAVLDLLELSPKDYVCSFTLNTTYGLNFILSQLPENIYKQVVTSEIEHNSVFLPTIGLSKRLNIKRQVLPRDKDGNLQYSTKSLEQAVVVINVVSNIDGRVLNNLSSLVSDTHKRGGIVILDAAQAVAHQRKLLLKTTADAICFSAHKMYAPSLGIMVIRQDLLISLVIKFVGGGMISSVGQQGYALLPNELHTWLEPGLQAYGEIIALGKAVSWLKTVRPFGNEPTTYINNLSSRLFSGLQSIDGLNLFNTQASSVISFYPKKGDAHRLSIFLSGAGVMARSGTFCCHYYLNEVLKSPPLLRLSLGLHNTTEDVDTTLKTLTKLTKG